MNDNINNPWDIETLPVGHEKRFLKKLKNQKKTKKHNFLKLSIAACFLVAFGAFLSVSIINYNSINVELSNQTQQTEDYFSSVINSELKNLKSKQTPKNKQIIFDAIQQLELLEKDYNQLKLEIGEHGENKQIIFAMLTNMETRIAFIKSVINQVENINQIKSSNNEKVI